MYIYEQTDWPQFYWHAEAVGQKLAEVRHQQGLLLGRLQALGFHLQDEAVLQTLIQDVTKSSEIEGEHLNKDEVRSSIARRLGLDVGGLVPAGRHVEGVVDMLLDATQRYDQPLTPERLFAWHAALFPTGYSGLNQIKIGTWRDDAKGPMQVVSGRIGREKVHFEAPPAASLPSETARFLAWFNTAETGIDPVLKAAMAHLWFITLHPFEDGNGRMARSLTDLLLARSEHSSRRFYSMSAQIQVERNAYYDMLETTQKGTLDITAWLLWFLSCFAKAMDAASKTLAAITRKAQFWEQIAGQSFNERQHAMLNRLLDGFDGKLTSSKWAKITKCSQDTAHRDILDLLQRGILTKAPEGGRSTSYLLETTPHIQKETP